MDDATKRAEAAREDSFERRLMSLKGEAGTRRPTTWQQSHLRDARFNALGCL